MTRRGRPPRKRNVEGKGIEAIRGKDKAETTWLTPTVLNPEDCDACGTVACENHCAFCTTGQSCKFHGRDAA